MQAIPLLTTSDAAQGMPRSNLGARRGACLGRVLSEIDSKQSMYSTITVRKK